MNVPIYRVARIVIASGALAVLAAGCRQQGIDSTASNSENVPRRSTVGTAFQQDSDSAADSDNVAQRSAVGSDSSVTPVSHNRRAQYPRLLSEYALFDGAISELQPAEGVVQYDVNTPSFADYAVRQRVVRLPPGTSAKYTDFAAIDFPVGTIIAKTFYYLHDMTQPDAGRHLIETRILWRQESGWIGIPYLWNEDQSDARLALAGGAVPVQWVHKNGEQRSNTHI
ncbi:MAG: hypothetical protein KDA51_19095, partial [Planctomycetales bacterium]|nr:hypothetical protein [Planctomycetales bacterium]